MKCKSICCLILLLSALYSGMAQLSFSSTSDLKNKLKGKKGDQIATPEYTISIEGMPKADATDLFNHTKLQKFQKGDAAHPEESLAQAIKNAGISVKPDAKNKITVDIPLNQFIDGFQKGDSLKINFATSKDKLGTYTLSVVGDDNTTAGNGNNNTQHFSEQELFNLTKMTLPPLDAPGDGDCCCADKIYPCDEKDADFIANRIVYLADKNLTVFYDNTGTPYLIGHFGKNFLKGYTFKLNHFEKGSGGTPIKTKPLITLRANSPLGFEVVNVNPQAYDIEITDTAIRLNTDAASLFTLQDLAKAAGFSVQASKDATKKTPSADDPAVKAHVAVYFYIQELQKLLLALQNTCLNKQNEVIFYKQAAKKRIDSFFVNALKKGPALAYDNYLTSTLTDADSTLKKTFLSLYNQLPAAYYKFATQVPHVDGSYDKIAFMFNIKPKPNTPYVSPVKQKTVEAWILGGFKADISTGIYYATLKNQAYSIRADSTVGKSVSGGDSVYNRRGTIYKEKSSAGEAGFAAFIHFYPKMSPDFNIGGNLGAGISFAEKPQARYFAGLSFLFGRDNRIALNTGAIFGNVSELSNQYTQSASGSFNPVSIGEAGKDPSYVKRFKAGFFVSISYNLPFLKIKSGTTTQQASGTDAASDGGSSSSASAGNSKKTN